MQATGSVTWVVGAQASVLGGCWGGGGVPFPSASSSALSGASRFKGLGGVRCYAQVQDKKPRVRKSKEERREMVESFVNTYRVSNGGKFPSVNLTHKEVGGSYYIVREIVRDIIQENRVLGPGGLNAKALSFEDCPDYAEASISHELDQNNIEILDMSENQDGKVSVLEMSDEEEVFSSQKNLVSTHQLLGSSNLLEAGILNSVVQNGNVGDAICLESNVEKQDEALFVESRDIESSSSERQATSFTQVSDVQEVIEQDSLGDAYEGTTSDITDEVTLPLETSVDFQTNGALLQGHPILPNDRHDDISNGAVDEPKLCSETNGALQTNQNLLQEQEILTESIRINDVQVTDVQFSSTSSANQVDVYSSKSSPETVDSAKSIELLVQKVQDGSEQPPLDASLNEQDKLKDLASQPDLEMKGLLQMEGKHSTVVEDEHESKKSFVGMKSDHEAGNASDEHGMRTTTAIGRRTGKTQQKKEDNLFWLIIRAFVVSMSKLWAK